VVLIDPYAQDLTLGLVTEADERAARRTLRDQIARLEAQLADCVATALPARAAVAFAVAGAHGPRVLGIAELERVRDDLADRLAGARRALTERGLAQERARVRLERMLLAPGRHKFERVAAAELGEGGCGVYQVRPRLGLIGMLAGWWHVKLSSGCPLAT
jgi:uncharacterized small protein (DUF1192 family)